MYRKATPLFLICQSPLHAGSGSELGIVDLPIQRERHTSFPKIESSSLKGAIREAIERKVYNNPETNKTFKSLDANDTKIHRAFGYDEGSLKDSEKKALKDLFENKNKKGEYATDFAGALGFTDARLLFFPVKSMKGVFAWVTCPKSLKQFVEDMKMAKLQIAALEEVANFSLKEHSCITTSQAEVILKGDKGSNVILEEYTFNVSEVKVELENLGKWLADNILHEGNQVWAEKLAKDIIILPNDDFKDFVNLSTEVITRTKIDNSTGTVATGALFTEEYLPAESIMYSLVLTAAEFKAEDRIEEGSIRNFFNENLPPIVQIGGNATLGKGIVTTKFLNENGRN
ncbi:type III-B CRISPR module RAMP protein Cmr4 [Rapidithrix thailandica]|uniref:Type III-B CRISPR module RAMP protein Cmr4 n=1 Tax=Rapidithrix thailandica TaxID=413964 RepID=A0AAW9S3M1_9BACT